MKSAFFAILVLGCCFAGNLLAADLTGTVQREDGSPMPKATVLIYTAGPKTGTSIVCPSCYPDCTKRAQTDTEGKFRIESLDPKLVFNILVVAAGFKGEFVSKVDPTNGPVTATMKALDAKTMSSKSRVAGIVLDGDGKPVAGATISPEGIRRGSITHWGGTDKYVEPLACTDEKGFFLLPCTDEVDEVHAVADGRGLAKRWVTLAAGKDHVIRMAEGVAVKGRLTHEGKPLKDVVVAMVTSDRTCGNFLRDFESVTDKDGAFLILNVTPEYEYALFAKMESLGNRGALKPRKLRVEGKDKVLEVGELKTTRANLIVGRVVLTDGKPVPEGTRMFLGREGAWDHTELPVKSDGSFEFSGLADESVGLSLRVKGYKFSKRNPSLDWLNGGIVGRVEADILDLVLEMEPGEWRPNREEDDCPEGTDRQPRDKPLRGVKS